MMETPNDPSFERPVTADDPQIELYTIPSHSSWFSWDDIHEIERLSLNEFFNGTSITRTPKIYRDYRDFIISKYREDCSRRLTFTEVRKSLVGDVSYLRKVFLFLEKWGLINFSAESLGVDGLYVDEEGWDVRVEDGPPHGVRIVVVPNSLKPVLLPPIASSNGSLLESDFKMPPLASHSDVYSGLVRPNDLVCEHCRERCNSGHYEYAKEGSFLLCSNCFKNGNYGETRSADDFKFVDSVPNRGNHEAIWSESETILLLESVLKHGDNWDRITQNVQTKSKEECMSKLIQLPFGALILGNSYDRQLDTISNANTVKTGQVALTLSQGTPSQETVVAENGNPETNTRSPQIGDGESEGPPLKRVCVGPITDVSGSPTIKNQNNQQVQLVAAVTCEKMEIGAEHLDPTVKDKENGESGNQILPSQATEEVIGNDKSQLPSPPSLCSARMPDSHLSLTEQVSRISIMVGPQITASAAEAAVVALCYENMCPREIFEVENNGDALGLSSQVKDTERVPRNDDSEVDGGPTQSEKSDVPLTLRMRAATAAALGAAAARAKMLVVQEDRKVERLVSIIIETQLKKLNYKMKLVEDLESMMEEELSVMADEEEYLLSERMAVVERVLTAGIQRWKDQTSVKPPTGSTIF